MTSLHVFHDPTGRRRAVIVRVAAVLALAITLCVVVFVACLVFKPLLPLPGASIPAHLVALTKFPSSSRNEKITEYLLRDAQVQLAREIAETGRITKQLWRAEGQQDERIVGAFYSPREESGIRSLKAHAQKLTHLFPEWLTINRDGKSFNDVKFSTYVDSENAQLDTLVRANNLKVFVTLSNYDHGSVVLDGVRALLGLRLEARRTFVSTLRDWLSLHRVQGVNIDFRGMDAREFARLPGFIKEIRRAFIGAGLGISVTFDATMPPTVLWRVAVQSDLMVMVLPSRRNAGDPPAPLASITWYADALQQALRNVPAQKLLIALENFAVDWTPGGAAPERRTYVSGLLPALGGGEASTRKINFDPIALNPWFAYTDNHGVEHTTWFLDAVTSYNQWAIAARAGVRGVGIWDVGNEDPATWDVVSARSFQAPPTDLEQIRFPSQIQFEGRGDIISIRASPADGERALAINKDTGLVSSLEYKRIPGQVVVERSGYKERSIALTYDDGPATPYTEEILDILRSEGVKATFFVIGEHAEQHPSTIRRILDEGHVLGNHTWSHVDMANVSVRRRELELNATQRLLQSITGRSVVLFRPPYIDEHDPSTPDEVDMIRTAQRLRYFTVGISANAQDWQLWKTDAEGKKVQRTGRDVADSMLEHLRTAEGNAILLHDGGGDRSATVEATRILIPELRALGFNFKTVAELAGFSNEQVHPEVQGSDLVIGKISKFFFNFVYGIEYALGLLLLILVALGSTRLVFVISLALASRLKERYDEEEVSGDPLLPVSVIVPAHNEGKVICRTIESILRSDHKDLEIVVVDDGSTDETAEEVEKQFGLNPTVRLIRQANAGKAAALNHGIAEARHDILVCLDGDTQFAPEAISKMVRHFRDPTVGAVAGNVKVGNRRNILTHWQSIEYIFNISLNRRAYAMLNAIVVVSGAAGAWRKSAVQALGGFQSDTLAEDMDLTWRVRRAEWKVLNESQSISYTEAPETLSGLFKQRFRWAYGAMQCLWKHRGALFHHGWFGWVGVPSVLLFQVLFELLAPIADLQMLYGVITFSLNWLAGGSTQPEVQVFTASLQTVHTVMVLYISFFAVELGSTMIAFKLDRESMRPLWMLFLQRFVYRQVMYIVIWRAAWKAVSGWRQGWGVLNRTGTVNMPTPR